VHQRGVEEQPPLLLLLGVVLLRVVQNAGF